MGGGDQELNIGSERERIHMVPFSESYSSIEISSLSIRPLNELGSFGYEFQGSPKKKKRRKVDMIPRILLLNNRIQSDEDSLNSLPSPSILSQP